MKVYVPIVSVMLMGCVVVGCRTFNDTKADMRYREDLLTLREELSRIQGRIEGLELEYQRILMELEKLRTIAANSEQKSGAIRSRLDELERRLLEVDAARTKDYQMIVDQLSGKIAEILSKGPSDSARTSARGYEHVVKDGETLSEIASAYKVKVRVIVEANDLENPDVLKTGQKLFIPQ